MAKDGTVTVKITGDSKGLEDALGESDGHLSKFGDKMGGLAKGVGTAFVGMGGAALGFGIASVKAFADHEKVAAQTQAVLKSTGGAAKVTADHVDGLADSLEKMSGVDGDAIQAGENLLLTFTNVKNGAGKNNDIFDQTTKIMTDMSVALGTDASTSAIQLGKALNDPVAGVSALSKVGVSFTAAQKDQIKAMVASGDTMGAQKLILKELSTEFGGSAEAAGKTFGGQLNILKARLGDVMEEVGSKLVPVLMKLGEWLGENIPKAIEFLRPTFELVVTGVKAFVSALKDGDVTSDGFVGVMERIGDTIHRIIPVVKDVIGWVQDFVAKFRGGQGEIGDSASKLGQIVTQIKEYFQSAFEAIQAVVTVAVAIITDLWDRFGSTLLEFMKGTWNGILEVIRAAFEIITGVFDLVKAIFTGKWGEAWDAILKILDGAWDLIVGVIRNVLTNIIPTLFEAAKALLSAAFGLIWNALQTVLSDAWDIITGAIGTAIGGVVTFFTDLPGRIVGAAGDLFGFIRTKMDDARQWVSDRIGDVVTYFVEFPGNLARGAGEIFQFVKTKMDDAKQWVSDRLGDVVGFFTGMPGRIFSAASGMFDGIKEAFRTAINWIIGAWDGLHFKLGGWKIDGPFGTSVTLPTVDMALPYIHPLAAGGVVTRPTLAVLGEAGPEAVIPLSRFGGSGSTVTNYYEISVTAIDPASAQEAVVTAIREYERRNGQGWRT